jgi:hypothetical protein
MTTLSIDNKSWKLFLFIQNFYAMLEKWNFVSPILSPKN